MKNHSHKIEKKRLWRLEAIVIGVLVNVVLAFLTNRLGVPLYMDTVGTIAVAAIGGMFPGIVTAVATNVLCTIFNGDALYFASVNAVIAIYVAWFMGKGSFRKISSVVIHILVLALISGCASAFIQWGLLGGPQHVAISDAVDAFQNATGIPKFAIFVVVNILLNILDKGFSVGAALFVMRMIPREMCAVIRESAWRQKPLTNEELNSMKVWGKDIRHSIRTRISLTMVGISLALVIVMGWIGVSLYFNMEKAEKTEVAKNAAKFAAEVVEPEKIDDYLRNGEDEPGYKETEHMLYKIRENAAGVEYLYVVKIVEDDGCYFVFDLDTEGTASYEPGEKIEFEEAFKPYLPALYAGEEIEPIESDDITGWVLTVYYPVRDEDGNCVCYVGADVSLAYMAGYMKGFALKVVLILAGFFILILAYGLWTTGIFVVYPINRIAACVDGFVQSGDKQEVLDENVSKIQEIDVRTENEVEKLYDSICEMSRGMVEQMRDIRHYTDATAKMQNGLIITMADMVENRDSDTGAHIQKTAAYVRIILEGLKRKGYYAEKLTPKYMQDVEMSAPLHDVGKINIPDAILNKPGKLTDEEYEIMKTHTTAGKNIMEKAINTVQGGSYLKEARNMAAYHHERWDGKGYPEGLREEVIPLSARIMAVADVFDALASPRVYKPAFPLEKALGIIEEGAGSQFDPKCVEVFMESISEVKVILKKYQGMQ